MLRRCLAASRSPLARTALAQRVNNAVPALVAQQQLASLTRAFSTGGTTDDALLIKVSGQDRAGITTRFTELLASTGCEFYDIDQPYCQPWCSNNLSLYFLVGMPKSPESESSFIRSVLDKSQREGLSVEF